MVDFETQCIEITNPRMIETSPTMRKYMTLTPGSSHQVTLFYNEHKFDTEMHIVHISTDAVRLSLSFIPVGLKVEDSVVLNIVLNEDKKPIIVHTKAVIHKVVELKRSYELVLILETDTSLHKVLVEYIAKRQMQLIREFKGLEYER